MFVPWKINQLKLLKIKEENGNKKRSGEEKEKKKRTRKKAHIWFFFKTESIIIFKIFYSKKDYHFSYILQHSIKLTKFGIT